MIGDPTNEHPTEVICGYCGCETKLKWEDHGVGQGSNDFKSLDKMVQVTVCCGFEDWTEVDDAD